MQQDEDFDRIEQLPDTGWPLEEELGSGKPKGRTMHETARRTERVILVGVTRPPSQHRYETDEHLEELELLATTAGADIVEKVFQNKSSIEAATFIGKGKAEYVAQRCADADVQTVIFDDDLAPIQQRNLERILQCKVLDRTALILDIFAMHARTNTAKTQVELAQLEYLLPRLSGMWTHFSKQLGGIGTKGPGETQIETDRRILRERIRHLKQLLKRIDRQRETQRSGRKDVVRIALVGYTNVGKSTLLNILTGADVLVEDKLFATLDSTVRALEIGRRTVLLTDTVGFIRKLPTRLIASFKTTLDEVVEADLVLHVVDVSHHAFRDQIAVVNETLKEIHADGKPTVTVFNKVDKLPPSIALSAIGAGAPNPVFISAGRGINLGELLETIRRIIEETFVERVFEIRPPDFRVMAEFHREATILEETYEPEFIRVRCELPAHVAERLRKVYPGIVRELPAG